MNISDSLKIIRKLADGVSPYTGKEFSANSAYQQPDTIRALFKAVWVLERVEKTTCQQKPGYLANVGKPWHTKEEKALGKAFDAGKSISQIAKQHKRTETAIRIRLVSLGKIKD